MHTHTHTHTHIHTYTHLHTHICKHTQTYEEQNLGLFCHSREFLLPIRNIFDDLEIIAVLKFFIPFVDTTRSILILWSAGQKGKMSQIARDGM
jgi:hypothetical protein